MCTFHQRPAAWVVASICALGGSVLAQGQGVTVYGSSSSVVVTSSGKAASVTMQTWGTLPDGRTVQKYSLANGAGMAIELIDYGGIITSMMVPDRDGQPANVVLGFKTLEPYLERHPYFGAICGRYSNRIAGGQFTLDGETYQLAKNNGPNHLHGGVKGFDTKLFKGAVHSGDEGASVKLSYTSPDGEEGYPGTLQLDVTYTLTHDNALRVDYTATTDKPTVLNPTQHSYFNLAGRGTVLNHLLRIDTDRYLPVDATSIPLGDPVTVDGTPFDFRAPHTIGQRINDLKKQQKEAGIAEGLGYDHNYCLEGHRTELPRLVAVVSEPESGRIMEVHTTEPGLQLYTGNYLDGAGGTDGNYPTHGGLCLEAQVWPDTPNHPSYPPAVLRPGNTYTQTTIYRFTTDAKQKMDDPGI